VKSKNQLWFHAWRPMNWAFLAGDRTEQQASRDHRDPKIRWFPAEMEQYGPLVTEADARIESLAAQIQPVP
jgi:aryl-alcohol dehydrogenase-like predicted oxidoreductase